MSAVLINPGLIAFQYTLGPAELTLMGSNPIPLNIPASAVPVIAFCQNIGGVNPYDHAGNVVILSVGIVLGKFNQTSLQEPLNRIVAFGQVSQPVPGTGGDYGAFAFRILPGIYSLTTNDGSDATTGDQIYKFTVYCVSYF
jgi:hypothetical protein